MYLHIGHSHSVLFVIHLNTLCPFPSHTTMLLQPQPAWMSQAISGCVLVLFIAKQLKCEGSQWQDKYESQQTGGVSQTKAWSPLNLPSTAPKLKGKTNRMYISLSDLVCWKCFHLCTSCCFFCYVLMWLRCYSTYQINTLYVDICYPDTLQSHCLLMHVLVPLYVHLFD